MKSPERPYIWLVLLAVTVLSRLGWFLAKGGMYFPDEMFQYVEPVHWRITGDAYLPWELEAGARHWIVPTFFAPWVELGRAFGLERWSLYRFGALHATLFSALAVPAALHMGRAANDERAGWIAAWMVALFPVLGYFAPHTLSELPAMILLAFAHAAWLGIVQKPDAKKSALSRGFIAGVLLIVAGACRLPALLSLPLILIDLALFRSRGGLVGFLLGFGLGVTVLGAVDALTWGSPWHSAIAFVQANRHYEHQLVRAHLTEPSWFYAVSAYRSAGLTVVLLALSSLLTARRQARLVLAWALPVVALSFLGNKQDRFLLPLWPIFLTSAAVGISAVLGRLGQGNDSRVGIAAALALSLAALPATVRLTSRRYAGVFLAQAWIGARTDATGLLLDGGWNAHGGYFLLGRSVPMVPFSPTLARHRLFNYVIAFESPLIERMQRDRAFEAVVTFEGTTIFRRRATTP